MRAPVFKFSLIAGLLLALGAMNALAADAQRYLIVKIEGHDEEITYEILTSDQHKELLATIRLENRFHSEAIKGAKTAWRESAYGKRSFPTRAIQRRKARVEGASNMTLSRAQSKRDELKQRFESRTSLGTRRSNSSLDKKRKNVERRKKNAFNTDAYKADQNKQHQIARKLYIHQLNALIAAENPPEETSTDLPDTNK